MAVDQVFDPYCTTETVNEAVFCDFLERNLPQLMPFNGSQTGLQAIQAADKSTVVDFVCAAFSTATPDDCYALFKHAGYTLRQYTV